MNRIIIAGRVLLGAGVIWAIGAVQLIGWAGLWVSGPLFVGDLLIFSAIKEELKRGE